MDGPLLVIDRDGTTPIGVQLVEGLRRGILSGALRAGDPMPSTRTLSHELGVARSSVVAAYDRLVGEGYLETRQGASTRVAVLERHPSAEPIVPEASARPVDEPDAAAPRVDLAPGVPSMARLDERAWRAAWRAAGAVAVPATAPHPFGLPELRVAVADHLRFARGVACTADDVVVTAGTSEAIALITIALAETLGRRSRVAVELPGYPTARRTVLRHGGEVVPVPVRLDGIDLAELGGTRAPVDAVMVTPSHQYPLGGRLPVADRLTLLDLAAERDWLVIEDDYDSEFRHTGAPMPALASLDRNGRAVLVGSFSKVLTPWLRLGYLVLPSAAAGGPTVGAFREAVAAIRADENTPVPGPVQAAMTHLLESGALRRHIAATRRDYAHRRALVIEALDGCRAVGAELSALDGGLHAVLTLPDERMATDVVARLRADGVHVPPLSQYAGNGPDRPAGIVIGYAGVSDTVLGAALAQVRAAVLDAAARFGLAAESGFPQVEIAVP